MRERKTAPRAPEIGTVELIVALRNFPGAAELHADELAVLGSVVRPRRLRKNEVLTREDQPMHAIYLVLEGEIAVRRGGELVERAGPGSTLGVLPSLARDTHGLECRAVAGALVLQISMEDLEDVFEEVPSVLVHLVDDLARRLLARGLVARAASVPAASPRSGPTLPPSRPLDLVERILHLRACPALARASIDAIAALAALARERRVPSGELLWNTGTPASALFVIVQGELELLAEGRACGTLRAGDLAGAAEALAGAPHPGDARARGTLVVFAVDREALLDAWEDHTDLGVELLADVSARLLASA